MKVAGITAEFNPFHNGHKYIIDYCKKDLKADYVVVVMSGDFVQRGAPALLSKFSRARMALNCGADLVLELPVYYSLGSAEYFAEGAISILEGLGVITDIAFGSEWDDILMLENIADILVKEPESYKKAMQSALENGETFPAARTLGLIAAAADSKTIDCQDKYKSILSSPNSILALEYLKALKKRGSSINVHAVKRTGASYNDVAPKKNDENAMYSSKEPSASALGIREFLKEKDLFKDHEGKSLSESSFLINAVPQPALMELSDYPASFLDSDSFSELLRYKLTLEKADGFTKYLDVNEDLSNRITTCLSDYKSFDRFCELLKSKNLTYTRLSRSLMHILLNITKENMLRYKSDNYTAYGRILGIKKDSSELLTKVRQCATIPVPKRLKDFEKELDTMQLKLFNETLISSEIYNYVSGSHIRSEYSLLPIVL